MGEKMITPTRYAIHKKGESPVFGENTIFVEVDDHGAGMFMTVYPASDTEKRISFDFEDFDELVLVVQGIKRISEQFEKSSQMIYKGPIG